MTTHDPALAAPRRTFGDLLRAARLRRGLSQLALADAANVSTRHLSFIECGRSRPGYATTVRLVEALGVGTPLADQMLAAAGFHPPGPQGSASAAQLGTLAAPPTALMTHEGSLLACNDALHRALALVDDLARRWRRTCGNSGHNLLLLSFHPEGLAPFMENHDEIARLTLGPLVLRARDNPEASRVLARLRRFPRVRAVLDSGLPMAELPPAVPEA